MRSEVIEGVRKIGKKVSEVYHGWSDGRRGGWTPSDRVWVSGVNNSNFDPRNLHVVFFHSWQEINFFFASSMYHSYMLIDTAI